jgi:histidinol dehydrogenase
MLAQAEHGSGDEVAVCVTESTQVARSIAAAVVRLAESSPSRDVFRRLKADALCICVTASRVQSMALVNRIAPEHLQLMTASARADLKSVRNAGGVFIGRNTPVALGDYYIGTNHVLPTGGAARFASALGTDDFQKRISVATVSAAGIRKAAARVALLARSERFEHHARSAEGRL